MRKMLKAFEEAYRGTSSQVIKYSTFELNFTLHQIGSEFTKQLGSSSLK